MGKSNSKTVADRKSGFRRSEQDSGLGKNGLWLLALRYTLAFMKKSPRHSCDRRTSGQAACGNVRSSGWTKRTASTTRNDRRLRTGKLARRNRQLKRREVKLIFQPPPRRSVMATAWLSPQSVLHMERVSSRRHFRVEPDQNVAFDWREARRWQRAAIGTLPLYSSGRI